MPIEGSFDHYRSHKLTSVDNAGIDVSIILNVHRDEKYFRRTMMSLEEAVRYALSFGLRIELVVVLDRSNTATIAWYKNYNATLFYTVQIEEVDNGCLGLSRNDGIRLSQGNFVMTFDTDDLVSFNYIVGLYEAALEAPIKSMIFPEFTFGFGSHHFLCRYRESPELSMLNFVTEHPFISRFLTRRITFDDVSYADLHLSEGYAYEDWHLNAEIVGRGFKMCIAPSTTIYYRQRRKSLVRAFDGLSTKQIPFASLFEPATFVKICSDDYDRFRRGDVFQSSPAATRSRFLSSRLNVQAAVAANSIDTAVDISVIEQIPAFTNAEGSSATGAAYYELARELRGATFTDVVLFPFMTTGGGEKYILNILNTLKDLDNSRHFLIVTGQGGVRHKWIERLPQGSFFLDIFNRFPALTNAQREVLVLKLIQATALKAMLHLKCSQFAQDFFVRFAAVLSSNKAVFYRFSDSIRRFADCDLVNGFSADFVSENMEMLDLVIVDNERMLQSDLARMDGLIGKEFLLPTLCELADMPPRATAGRSRTKRLLWASRLDPEKRPELLLSIAIMLASARPELSIDVWGESFSAFDISLLSALPNVRSRGHYSDFASIGPENYDAFIYTTAYDGLPNVVIEAMASGLPVIAPDIGGIPETVQDHESGVILSSALSDEALVTAYINAISWLYESEDRVGVMGQNAYARVQERHCSSAFKTNVARIFTNSSVVKTSEEAHGGNH